MRKCGDCGLVFLWPRPSADELTTYYREIFRTETGEPGIEERHRNDLAEARTRVLRCLAHVGPAGRVLEVGSGSGAFLASIRPYVSATVGIEPDTGSRTWSSTSIGVPVLSDIAELDPGVGRFDLVVLLHVLEHVHDPIAFLRGLRPFLAETGRLVIELPNVDDALVTTYAIPAYLAFYYQKAHLYYFSAGTLARTLEAAGYSATIEGIQRYDLSNHLRWMLIGRPGGQGYYEMLTPAVHAAYGEALTRAGHADTLWAVACVRE